MPIRIDRCTLVGTDAAIRQARRAIATCPWPTVGDAEVVILRRIEARARPAALPARLYQATDRLLAARVDGWSPAADTADCVWFRSAAELLARLSLDLAAGQARNLWFWQSYRRWLDDPAGLARLWLDHVPRLPAVCRVLIARRGLAPVWRRIDGTVAAALLPRLAPAGLLANLRETPPAADAGGAPELDLVEAVCAFGVAPAAFAEPDRPDADRALLALMLTVAALRPHWLGSPQAVRLITRLRLALSESARREVPTPRSGTAAVPTSVGPRVGDFARRRIGTEARGALIPAAADRPGTGVGLGTEPGPPAPTAISPAASDSSRRRMRTQARHPGVPEQADANRAADALGPEAGAPQPEAEPTWQVEQGGLFYLINLLNHPLIRQRLFADADAMAFPSGWGWLYRLGEALGLAPEPALTQCLAGLAGLPAEGFGAELPALGLAPAIVAWAEQRYRGHGIAWPAVLARPARIDYRRPELDASFRLADLDVSIRRVGLDIDPGWVDWLGTAVRFHYRGSAGWPR